MKKIFFLYWADKSSQDKNLLYLHNEPNEPTKEGLLSFVLLESQFPQFQQSPGATPLCLSVSNPAKSYTAPCEIIGFCCFPTVNCPYLPAPGGAVTIISDVCQHHLLARQKAWARNGPSISRIENVSLGFKIADCLSSGIAI